MEMEEEEKPTREEEKFTREGKEEEGKVALRWVCPLPLQAGANTPARECMIDDTGKSPWKSKRECDERCARRAGELPTTIQGLISSFAALKDLPNVMTTARTTGGGTEYMKEEMRKRMLPWEALIGALQQPRPGVPKRPQRLVEAIEALERQTKSKSLAAPSMAADLVLGHHPDPSCFRKLAYICNECHTEVLRVKTSDLKIQYRLTNPKHKINSLCRVLGETMLSAYGMLDCFFELLCQDDDETQDCVKLLFYSEHAFAHKNTHISVVSKLGILEKFGGSSSSPKYHKKYQALIEARNFRKHQLEQVARIPKVVAELVEEYMDVASLLIPRLPRPLPCSATIELD
jgi:hypothetical protein